MGLALIDLSMFLGGKAWHLSQGTLNATRRIWRYEI